MTILETLKIRLPGKLKGLFFVCRLDKIIPANLFNLIAHMTILSRWIAKHKKECDNDFYNFRYINKRAVYFEKIILRLNLDDAIDYLEFGVCEGNSFKWWVERIKNPQANFYGFDTFTGLPES